MAPNDKPSKPLPKDKEKRRRELERLKYQRQAEKRAQSVVRARKRTAVVGVAVVAVAGVAGGAWALSGSGSKTKPVAASSASPKATASAAAVHVQGCTTAAAGTPGSKQWKAEPAMSIDTKASYTATLDTNCGPVTLKLDAANAPHTVNSFVFLAGQHFFDHVKCHRLTTGGLSVLQCGDPTGSGSGGPGYTIPDENLKDTALKGGTYPAGTVAMANTGQAHTGGSQFFLVYKDSQLPASYTPFGTITGGLDILQRVAAAGTNNANGTGDGAPLQSVVMNSVTTAKG
ncbi:peptidyl-prolyl cis-trans isomerase B (cyclophilin B) [Streptacidiphilus sp. MAP12-16]|uniref:peptidylprolyl isomerase n=1 Tax=Streptacidiphilus sp. MAP12-16 TaxID=3156300 RepID=UPI003516D0EC